MLIQAFIYPYSVPLSLENSINLQDLYASYILSFTDVCDDEFKSHHNRDQTSCRTLNRRWQNLNLFYRSVAHACLAFAPALMVFAHSLDFVSDAACSLFVIILCSCSILLAIAEHAIGA
eukprot:3468631-Rhodomonas_salina.5